MLSVRLNEGNCFASLWEQSTGSLTVISHERQLDRQPYLFCRSCLESLCSNSSKWVQQYFAMIVVKQAFSIRLQNVNFEAFQSELHPTTAWQRTCMCSWAWSEVQTLNRTDDVTDCRHHSLAIYRFRAGMCEILQLPTLPLQHILALLDASSLAALCCTCAELRKSCSGSHHWKSLCMQRWKRRDTEIWIRESGMDRYKELYRGKSRVPAMLHYQRGLDFCFGISHVANLTRWLCR